SLSRVSDQLLTTTADGYSWLLSCTLSSSPSSPSSPSWTLTTNCSGNGFFDGGATETARGTEMPQFLSSSLQIAFCYQPLIVGLPSNFASPPLPLKIRDDPCLVL